MYMRMCMCMQHVHAHAHVHAHVHVHVRTRGAMSTAGGEEEVARLTYELERVEEGRRRLRAALAEQRAAADAYADRAEAEVIAAAGGSTGGVVVAHGDLCQSLRSRLDATSAEEDARAHDLRATCAALQLSAALASTEYRCMLLPLPTPTPAPAPASDLGLLGSWTSWMGEPPEAKLAAEITDVQQRLSHVKSLVQETSLSSLLALAFTLLQRQNAPAVEAVGALQEHATVAAGHAGTLPEGESQPKDDVTPERAVQPLLALVGSAGALLEQVAGHRAEAAREMRDLAWQFRTLPLYQSANAAPSAAQAELEAQAREAVLSSELLAVEQQLLFCAAPMSDQLAANATAEQNAGLYRSRATNVQRQLADAQAGMAAAQKDAAGKEARAVAAEERALMAEAFLTRAEKAEAECAALQQSLDEAPLPAWWRRDHARARAEATEATEADDPDAAETPAAAPEDRRGRKSRPRLEEPPPRQEEPPTNGRSDGAPLQRDAPPPQRLDDAARQRMKDMASATVKQHSAAEPRRARPVSKAPAVAPTAPVAQKAGGTSPPQREVARGSAQALIDDAMAAAQADSARDTPRATEVGGRELPSYQSEAQLPRKPTPASDMD